MKLEKKIPCLIALLIIVGVMLMSFGSLIAAVIISSKKSCYICSKDHTLPDGTAPFYLQCTNDKVPKIKHECQHILNILFIIFATSFGTPIIILLITIFILLIRSIILCFTKNKYEDEEQTMLLGTGIHYND